MAAFMALPTTYPPQHPQYQDDMTDQEREDAFMALPLFSTQYSPDPEQDQVNNPDIEAGISQDPYANMEDDSDEDEEPIDFSDGFIIHWESHCSIY